MIKLDDNKLSIDTKFDIKKARKLKKINLKFIIIAWYYLKNKE